jgi:hypothetical protein
MYHLLLFRPIKLKLFNNKEGGMTGRGDILK